MSKFKLDKKFRRDCRQAKVLLGQAREIYAVTEAFSHKDIRKKHVLAPVVETLQEDHKRTVAASTREAVALALHAALNEDFATFIKSL
jgi:hypothetical protein